MGNKALAMDKIRYLRQSEIDRHLWDACIENSPNGRIYASSWFLDTMTEHWDALVIGNYETVMPLPWKSKYGLKYIYHPPFIQQLGVFSIHGSVDIFGLLQKIPKHFVKIDYFFSHSFLAKGWGKFVRTKRNFIIDLQMNYVQIANNYKSDLKKNLKTANLNGVQTYQAGHNSISTLIEIYRKTYGSFYANFEPSVYVNLEKMISTAISIGCGQLYITKLETGEVGAFSFFLKDKNRVYYFFGAPTELGKKYKCTPYLIDRLICEHAEKPLLFDFEGSEIPSVASFYQKFNPDVEYYHQVKYFNLLGLRFWF